MSLHKVLTESLKALLVMLYTFRLLFQAFYPGDDLRVRTFPRFISQLQHPPVSGGKLSHHSPHSLWVDLDPYVSNRKMMLHLLEASLSCIN